MHKHFENPQDQWRQKKAAVRVFITSHPQIYFSYCLLLDVSVRTSQTGILTTEKARRIIFF